MDGRIKDGDRSDLQYTLHVNVGLPDGGTHPREGGYLYFFFAPSELVFHKQLKLVLYFPFYGIFNFIFQCRVSAFLPNGWRFDLPKRLSAEYFPILLPPYFPI